MEIMVTVWLVILIALLLIEVATLGLTTIWFAGGALFALIAALLHLPLYVQIPLFLIVSFVLLFFTRPIAVRYFNGKRQKTNVEAMQGKRGIVTEEINNIEGQGHITVDGLEWTARSVDPDTVIPKGTIVTIQSIEGVKAIVSE